MSNNTAIILLLLSVGIFYTFTNDQYQQATTLYTLAGEYKDALNNTSEIETLRDNLLGVYSSISPVDIGRLSKVLPDNIDTVRLALDLDAIAARHGIAIRTLQAEMEPTGVGEFEVLSSDGPYENIEVTFSFVSNYDNFVSFVADLERNLRVMNITSVNFQAVDSGIYEHEITLETYWLK